MLRIFFWLGEKVFVVWRVRKRGRWMDGVLLCGISVECVFCSVFFFVGGGGGGREKFGVH